MTDFETVVFEAGCNFAHAVYQTAGLDKDRVVIFLKELISGDATLLPSPDEVKLGPLRPADRQTFFHVANNERLEWDAKIRTYAVAMLHGLERTEG
jgi:hypothetical protein